jgi:hypothetical protein
VWSPAALGAKLFSWYDPTLGLTIAADPALSDGDMEGAGLGPWTEATATVAKDAAIYYSGTQSLHLSETGAGSPQATQSIFTVGQRIAISARCRGDGGGGRVIAGDGANGNRFFTGSTAASWALNEAEATVGHANFTLTTYNESSQCWADDITLTNKSITAWADRSGHGHHFAQATATSQPWTSTGYGTELVMLDGAADYIKSSDAASTWTFLHDGTGMTLIVAWWADAAGSALGFIADTLLSGATASAINVRHDMTGGALNVAWLIGGSTDLTLNKTSGVGSATLDRGHVATLRYSETHSPVATCRLNGADVYSGARDVAPNATAPNQSLAFGSYASTPLYPLKGAIGRVIVCNAPLTDAEIAAAETWCGASVGVSI